MRFIKTFCILIGVILSLSATVWAKSINSNIQYQRYYKLMTYHKQQYQYHRLLYRKYRRLYRRARLRQRYCLRNFAYRNLNYNYTTGFAYPNNIVPNVMQNRYSYRRPPQYFNNSYYYKNQANRYRNRFYSNQNRYSYAPNTFGRTIGPNKNIARQGRYTWSQRPNQTGIQQAPSPKNNGAQEYFDLPR